MLSSKSLITGLIRQEFGRPFCDPAPLLCHPGTTNFYPPCSLELPITRTRPRLFLALLLWESLSGSVSHVIFSLWRVEGLTIALQASPVHPLPYSAELHISSKWPPFLLDLLILLPHLSMPPYCLYDCHYFYRTALRLLSIPTCVSALYA